MDTACSSDSPAPGGCRQVLGAGRVVGAGSPQPFSNVTLQLFPSAEGLLWSWESGCSA